MLLIQNKTAAVPLRLVSSVDHATPIVGAALSLSLSKNGASFTVGITGTASELGNGWYAVLLGTADTASLGSLLVRAAATGADEAHQLCWVVAVDANNLTNLGLANLDTTISSRQAGTSPVLLPITPPTGYGAGSDPDVTSILAAVTAIQAQTVRFTFDSATGFVQALTPNPVNINMAQVVPLGAAGTVANMLNLLEAHLTSWVYVSPSSVRANLANGHVASISVDQYPSPTVRAVVIT